jgi:mono/diheme cytochrome c family protein
MKMILSITCILAGGPALAQDLGAGRALAEEVCSACHVVEAGAGMIGERLSLPWEEGVALTFEDIANTVGVTEAALQVWLTSTHPTMPDFALGDEEIRDVVAYILSLRHEGA